ncbi:MAG TPA: acylphosphatase [Deltaproteobacteria bacterium]|nr:acylphosphatase [Deltaproteobacteria bacterium]HIJ35939.1 acylphosphatase [Deltaproteobacteria bacterium]HIJ40091.1 acylphosphatase [Deltaproteobacteria bacterium]
MGNTRVHMIVKGCVQGVWFRETTRREAVSLGISGWVRNLSDGTVEVLAEGGEDGMAEFVSWCHKGPSSANVNQIIKKEEEWRNEFSSFEIIF